MKKQLKKALISVFAFSLALSSAMIPNTPVSSLLTAETTVSADSSGEYKYAGNTFSYEIIGNGTSADIVRLTGIVRLGEATCPLPSTITVDGKSYSVTEIGDRFAENAVIRTISIPDTVKIVGHSFAKGAKIESISIGKNVQKIGSVLCKDCTNLRTVTYSGTAMTSLGDDPFKNTPFISNTNSRGAVTMGEWLIKYTGKSSSVTALNLAGNKPDIHKIAPSAFYGLSTLKSLNLNGISVLGKYACRGCYNLSTVTNAYAMENVEDYALNDTPWFSNESKKNGGTVLLERTLLQYDKCTNGVVDLSQMNIQYIASSALDSLEKKMTTLKLPGSILSIDRYAITVSNTRTTLKNIWLNGSNITVSNYKNYSTFLQKNMEAFKNSDWAVQIARDRGRQILTSLGIAYVGNGSKGTYSVEKEYQIANKLYHYVGKTYKYKFDYNGGSKNFIEEMLFPKGFVCRDYADMYMFLMELAGVNAERVNAGNGKSVNHAFNVVELGVDWFFVDTCWYNGDDLYMVNRTTLEKESSCHIVDSLQKIIHMPSDMFTLSSVPYCKYTIGDVNRDGQFDIRDAAMFREYLLGTRSLTANQKILSDVNRDGVFDKKDLKAMTEPKNVGSRRVGDVNGDGKINTDDAVKLQKYILGAQSLDEQSYYASDVLLDGTVDVFDLTLEKRLVLYPMGDVNMDQKINTADVTAITKFMNKTGTLTNEGKERADVNYDGVIDGVDITLIKNMMR